MLNRKAVGIGIAVVIVFVLGVSQLQAQSTLTLEGLSNRITSLAQRVTALSSKKADRSTVRSLEARVSALEAELEASRPTSTPTRRRPTATATRPRPTSTPTRVRPTATPTPAKAFITITRNMNVRSGPNTTYGIVGYATVGQEFDITGKNADGSWWRIEFKGENAWIYAPYVTPANTDRVRAVPTPTVAPRPTSTPVSSGASGTAGFAADVVFADQQSMGKEQEWNARSQSSKDEAILLTATLLEEVASYCDLSVAYTAALVDSYGDYLDLRGFTGRNPLIPVRQMMLFSVQSIIGEYPRRPMSCDAMFDAVTTRMLDTE